MRTPAASRREPASLWRVLVCVALAGLFLYNPFLGSARRSDPQALFHRLSPAPLRRGRPVEAPPVRPSETALSSSLWFRPPPAV
jgi:hypothetical protein